MTESTDFSYYGADSVYGALFLQFPKVLMYDEQYKHLNSNAKLAYMVLKDQLEYSLHNHWIDEEEHIYFVFTNQELENLFNCHNQKIVKLKKELETAHLLMQKRMGFNPKTEKDKLDHLYLPKLGVKAADVHLCGGYARKEPQTLAASGNMKIALPQETAQAPAASGNVKITFPHKSVGETDQTLATSGNVEVTHNLDRGQVLDTNRYNIDTQKLDFSTANLSPAEVKQQNHDLVKHTNNFLADEDSSLPVSLEPEAIQLLSFWCRTPQQMRRFIGIILNAKYKIEKDCRDIRVYIPPDDEELRPSMTRALRRYSDALRSSEKHIKDVENYLYGTMQNLFGTWWGKQAVREYAAKRPKEQDIDNEDFWDPGIFQKWHRSFLNDQTRPRS